MTGISRAQFKICAEKRLAESYRLQDAKLQAEIDQQSDEYISTVDEEAYVKSLVEKYRLDTPYLDFESITASTSKKQVPAEDFPPGGFHVRRGHSYEKGVVVFHIPCHGDINLLRYYSDNYVVDNGPRGFIHENHLCFEIIDFYDDLTRVKQWSQRIINEIKTLAARLIDEIERHNYSLEWNIRGRIDERKNKIKSIVQVLGVPIRKRQNVSPGYDATTLRGVASVPTVRQGIEMAAPRVIDGKYQLLEKLGEGNMGVVHHVRRTDIGLEAAIKLLDPKYLADRKAVERFKREAEAASRIRHANVVSIYDFGEAAGDVPAYIVMELVAGDSLRSLMDREQQLETGRAVSLMREICKGVAAGHKLGVVHRDLKPANIMVVKADDEEPERVKVLDFGLAKLRDADVGSGLTEAGTVLGTPFYMSPEQCRGESLDSRSDVYSLGIILYEMVAGKRPFEASDFGALSRQHINKPPDPLPDYLKLPGNLVAVIMRALSKEPQHRQADAAVLLRELKGITEPLIPSISLSARNTTEASTLEMQNTGGVNNVPKFFGLEETDTLVFKASCERAIRAGHLKHVSVRELLKDLQSTHIVEAEVMDSLEILSDRLYIQPDNTVGCGLRICYFEITGIGFEEYAKAAIVDYDERVESVLHEVVNLKKEIFEKPDIVVAHVLDQLAAEGQIQIAKFLGGNMKIMHVSAGLRRKAKG